MAQPRRRLTDEELLAQTRAMCKEEFSIDLEKIERPGLARLISLVCIEKEFRP